jgi:branched-chain amino acid transport system substrate-binding protein
MFVGAVGLAVVLSGCAGNPDSETAGGADDAGGTFNVLHIAGFSGGGATLANDYQIGLEAAAEMINAEGGIQGKEVVLSTLDSRSDPTQAVTQLQAYLGSNDAPDLVFNGNNSSETLATLPVLTENKVLSMSNATSNEVNRPDEYPYHFGMSATNEEALSSFALPEVEKYDRVASLVPSTAFGDSLAATIEQLAADSGAELVAAERFDPVEVDYTAQYQRVLAADPEMIFVDATGTDSIARVFEARRLAGGLDTPIVVGQGIAAVTPSKQTDAENLEACLMPAYPFTIAGRADQELIAPLAAKVLSDSQSGSVYTSGIAFDILRVAALGGESATSTTGEDMAAAMSELTVPEDYSLVFPLGYAYSSQTHFPSLKAGSVELIPCGSSTEDGFWVE